MPRSSAERELAFARRLTTAWQHAAPEVVFSHAGRDGDRDLLPSPLIRDLPLQAATPRAAAAPAWLVLRGAGALESVADGRLPPPVTPRGGTALLSDQAACPFRAAARHRLRADTLDEPAFGPTVLDRGTVTHAALQRIWAALGDSDSLHRHDDAALGALVQEAVDAELRTLAREAPQRLPEPLRALEQERLCTLLLDWLALERQRPPFAVEHTEHKAELEVHGLLLRIRPDRVDRLADGRRLVIDYKTGRPGAGPWADPRPDDVQLLLYAQCYADVAAVAYARLRTGECGFQGVAADEGVADGIRAFERQSALQDFKTWRDLLQDWDRRIKALAAELLDGVAVVQPKNAQACQRCNLHSLCRVHELQVGFDDSAEDTP
jgi:ATP-dependent helicase/nuclease subunit B